MIILSEKKCSLQVQSKNGNMLYGTAAQIKYVSDNGGWDAFISKITSDAAKIAVDHVFNEMKKAKFKTVKGKKKVS